MNYFSSAVIAAKWGISERSVRNYCAQGRVEGAYLSGKTWLIPKDTEKPRRLNARPDGASALLERLRQERASSVMGGIYHKVQVELTYSSNHIEGSKLTHDQTRLIFETSTIGISDTAVPVDDVIETANHFRAIDYVIDAAEKPISEKMFKDLHRMLKQSTNDAAKEWFAVGNYKRFPNEVAGQRTTLPENVPEEIANLLALYDRRRRHTLDEILDFHVRFERIHPFQDGNGRIGRLIMFKECLASGIVPFVITDNLKAFYYRGLQEWDRERGYLRDTCLAAQDTFKKELDYFRIGY